MELPGSSPRFPSSSRDFLSKPTTPWPFLPLNAPSLSSTIAKNRLKKKTKLICLLWENFLDRRRREMDLGLMGLEAPLLHSIQQIMNMTDDVEKSFNSPRRTYVRDAKAMASTPADVKEYSNAYVFIIDMPGLKSGDINVQVEDDNVLLISGERKREEEKEGVKYLRMERRVGKFMRKFLLPENANTDAISAVCQDGILTVTVEKLPPPEPKKPKTIEVKAA